MMAKLNITEVESFLKEYPDASLRLATTMHEGSATFIKPIKTICGAEIKCHPNTASKIRDAMRRVKKAKEIVSCIKGDK